MKNQPLFSLEDKSKKLKCRLLQFLIGTLRVKMMVKLTLKMDRGKSGGAMGLGNLPVPGARGVLLIWMKSRAKAFCACSRCRWGLFGHFFSHLSFFFLSPSLWETARYRLKYCLKGPFSPKQPTNQNGQHWCAISKSAIFRDGDCFLMHCDVPLSALVFVIGVSPILVVHVS